MITHEINSGTPWIVQFAGQSSPWRRELGELTSGGGQIRDQLEQIDAQAEELLAPVLPELTVISAGRLGLVDAAKGPVGTDGPNTNGTTNAGGAFASVPGILLAQYGAWLDVQRIVTAAPYAVIGHSQGVLAAAMIASDSPASVLALARLIGAAATKVTRAAGAERTENSAMLSVRGVPRDLLADLAAQMGADLAIINSYNSMVVSGRPADLERLTGKLDAVAQDSAAIRAAKKTGGAPISPVAEFLDVDAPFHSHLLESAVAFVDTWAERCGISVDNADSLARAVLTDPLDWAGEVAETVKDFGHGYLVDLGPGNLQRLTTENLAGTGITYVDAGIAAARDEFISGGPRMVTAEDWSVYAPQLATIRGQKVLQTAFSRLTGRSPIILGGMTPTTVDPEIVAAAANAGHWVELAGGGQVTEEVLSTHLVDLRKMLEPGRTAQFNAMFLDRYLWDLQFGARRLVSRERAAGAPLDGVTISAGIPDLEEAVELIERLRGEGFPYIGFKPGTVDQIRQVLAIARATEGMPLIIQVEDGHAGGHHSWVDLADMLLATYREIREAGVILTVGGGMGVPERAAAYLTGEWSRQWGRPAMPVDAVFIGTVGMTAREAKTNRDVKELLVATPGVAADDAGGWIASGAVRGGVTSGLSQLRADIYQVENSSSAAGRLLVEVDGDAEAIASRRDEIIAAINKTSKPYFGDIEDMTYAQVVRRYTELSYPWTDDGLITRLFEMLQRFEARLSPTDHGEIATIFVDQEAVRDPHAAIAALVETYPNAETMLVSAVDAAWFLSLCLKYPKPVPFVSNIGTDVLQRWGSDSLWQSHDSRYTADQVSIIPGPTSVAGITSVDEPIADILARYEDYTVEHLDGPAPELFSRQAAERDEYLRTVPYVMWHGQLAENPAALVEEVEIRDGEVGLELRVPLDTFWDGTNAQQHAVRELIIPIVLPESVHNGGLPVVDDARLADDMRGMLAVTAGVGTTTIGGTPIEALPEFADGEAHFTFAVSSEIGRAHAGVTSPSSNKVVPSAILGSCWPTIYAAIGSGWANDYPVIEGLLSAVHLDHSENIHEPIEQILSDGELTSHSHCASIEESSAGRVVTIKTRVTSGETTVIEFVDRFAMRGRVTTTELPVDPAPRGGHEGDVVDTPRSILNRVTVTAPENMTAFAIVSGDFNPIHTSTRAAKMSGMDAALVHGMWLCAAAQHAVPELRITGWTYRMFGMVNLSDDVEITVERVGRIRGGGLALEVTCRIEGEIVAQASASAAAAATAYVYPGQGIQTAGMALDERADSPAARDVWERADTHTRAALGFSILAVVRDNPKSITAKGETYFHPEGILNLTQFTQVALATVAIAQTERLREQGALVTGASFAGHSLGEYTALSAYGQIFTLENVLEIVFRRGSTMHHLVPRDSEGRSNYQLGALRPNQFGVDDSQVLDYIAEVSAASGEFLEVVNLNLSGQQYAIAGTIAGLKALAADSARRAKEFGGKRPFMLIPGIDVPFHSSVLRDGVPDFRHLLEGLLPEDVHLDTLVGHYIPNLVARPFELTTEFMDAILEVVPSDSVARLRANFDEVMANPGQVARQLLVELLAWQFASPVRWIETQKALIDSGVEEIVEVGLASSPTLANLASKTLALPENAGANVTVFNLQRDAKRVLHEDVAKIAAPEEPAVAAPEPSAVQGAPAPVEQSAPAESMTSPARPPAQSAASAGATGPVADLPFRAGDALRILLAQQTKVRLDQIVDGDTVETLTNGVSSKRNQILMDMTAEFELSALDGAAEATLSTLVQTINSQAHGYKPFGPILTEVFNERLRAITGAAGAKPARINDRVSGVWQLGEGWSAYVRGAIVLGTREGKSLRGGELATLATPKNGAELDSVIDAAVAEVAAAFGVSVAIPSAGGAGGAVVDSAALDAFSEEITDVLADTAYELLAKLGMKPAVAETEDNSAELVLREAMTAELGSGWEKFVTPGFDARRTVRLCDRWATAREDVARIAAGYPVEANFHGVGEEVARQAEWQNARRANPRFVEIAAAARDTAPEEFEGQVAVITGVTPNSIAGAAAGQMLAGGATVIMTASRINTARLSFAKELYRTHATGAAELWLVPANLASFRDIDALIEWIGSEQRETVGATSKLIKPALIPDILLPFAAPSVRGSLADSGYETENQARVLLWGVERLLGGLAAVGGNINVEHRLHTILPGSPNRGTFGGDGAYGEVKAAFDAICNKWSSEPWGARTSLVHAKIGWVRGTGLMGHNDPLVAAVEAAGVHTWSTAEMGEQLARLASASTRAEAANGPVEADLTGGLDAVDLKALEASLPEAAAEEAGAPSIKALPNPESVAQIGADTTDWSGVSARPEDLVVMVGVGEVGPWGSSRTRLEAELGMTDEGGVDLTAAGVLELAWMMGLLQWHETPQPGWYDQDENFVDEAEIWERFRDQVVARSGVRAFVDDGVLADLGTVDVAPVRLESDVTFSVADEAAAKGHVEADPEGTSARFVDDEWQVTRKAGSLTYVPRRTTLSRTVGGQFPTDFDPSHWGIPASMTESMDRMAIWNLLTAVDAFVASGFTPGELLANLHPAEVASTQGTGFGGMTSMHRLYVDRFKGDDYPQDILQETLPNVVAAHTMQSYIGGYGSMIHPVGACATAAVSVEEGVDKIAAGKATFVVAGAIDDLQIESLIGFGDMNATANSQAMRDKGISERFFSRAGDIRRGGFVESQGGGTILLARGDLAQELGLPVLGVVGFVQSFADGIHTSIPAPGLGALAAGRGGRNSRLARNLRALGVKADDIKVLSKHDTSTNANDPNEAELHMRLANALGRSAGNPLYVISQKTLTGHSKGGAALFQMSGLTQVFANSTVPGNKSLDCLDPEFASDSFLVWPRKPIDVGTVKAALLTSLGFGHVSAIVALVHPGAFEQAIANASGEEAARQWRERASERLAAGHRQFHKGMIGHAPLFEEAEGRRFDGDAHEQEAAMLLDLDSRLGENGVY